mgnify:CR=1 FL=1
MFLDVSALNCQTARMNKRLKYPTPVSVSEAVKQLNNGAVVAMPTETVYGLAGLASNDYAVLSIYETKGRPRFNPLIVHCADINMAEEIAEFPALAHKLATAFWPGPLTMVLPKRSDAQLSDLVTAGLETVAIRLPAHPIAREMIGNLGKPVAAPSANPSGKLSPTSANHVIEGFGGEVPVVDGGDCDNGIESTIVAVGSDALTLLRPGSISAEELASVTGAPVGASSSAEIVAPGMLKSHYAPNAAVRLNAETANEGEVLLGFGEIGANAKNLSPTADLREAAKNLFSFLRALDQTGAKTIAVAPIPNEGIGIAINDRLARAAADRKD